MASQTDAYRNAFINYITKSLSNQNNNFLHSRRWNTITGLQSEKTLIFDYFDCHANPWAAKILCGFCVGIELCGCTLPFVVRFVYERSFLLLKFCQSMSLKSAPQADSFLFIWLHIIISRFAIMETKNTSWQSWLPERVLAIPIINLARIAIYSVYTRLSDCHLVNSKNMNRQK